jgi:hypothetical protein
MNSAVGTALETSPTQVQVGVPSAHRLASRARRLMLTRHGSPPLERAPQLIKAPTRLQRPHHSEFPCLGAGTGTRGAELVVRRLHPAET